MVLILAQRMLGRMPKNLDFGCCSRARRAQSRLDALRSAERKIQCCWNTLIAHKFDIITEKDACMHDAQKRNSVAALWSASLHTARRDRPRVSSSCRCISLRVRATALACRINNDCVFGVEAVIVNVRTPDPRAIPPFCETNTCRPFPALDRRAGF